MGSWNVSTSFLFFIISSCFNYKIWISLKSQWWYLPVFRKEGKQLSVLYSLWAQHSIAEFELSEWVCNTGLKSGLKHAEPCANVHYIHKDGHNDDFTRAHCTADTQAHSHHYYYRHHLHTKIPEQFFFALWHDFSFQSCYVHYI